MTTLAAWTSMRTIYPEFLNASVDGDEVVVILRERPTHVDGVRVCGHTCHPGGQHCNNYCNLHPDKSLPMADHPEPHSFERDGRTSEIRMPLDAFRCFLDEASGNLKVTA